MNKTVHLKMGETLEQKYFTKYIWMAKGIQHHQSLEKYKFKAQGTTTRQP